MKVTEYDFINNFCNLKSEKDLSKQRFRASAQSAAIRLCNNNKVINYDTSKVLKSLDKSDQSNAA